MEEYRSWIQDENEIERYFEQEPNTIEHFEQLVAQGMDLESLKSACEGNKILEGNLNIFLYHCREYTELVCVIQKFINEKGGGISSEKYEREFKLLAEKQSLVHDKVVEAAKKLEDDMVKHGKDPSLIHDALKSRASSIHIALFLTYLSLIAKKGRDKKKTAKDEIHR